MSRIGAFTPETAAMIAETVNRLMQSGVLRKGATVADTTKNFQQGLAYKTPTAGIPAGGIAECTQQVFENADSAVLIDETDAEGNPLLHEVYNVFGSDIGGDRIVLCLWMYGRRVVHAEDCP